VNKTYKSMFLAAAVLATTVSASAITHRAAGTLLVQQPRTAQVAGEDILLRDLGNGQTYLYVEERNGSLMQAFDVTDPGHIKLASSIDTGLKASYTFVRPVGTSSELIRFENGAGDAVVDFHKAKAPHVDTVEGTLPEPSESLSNSGYLAVGPFVRRAAVSMQPHDIEVVDTEGAPRVVATVANVRQQVTRPETGTVFLLGDKGVTLVRRLDVEQQHALDEASESRN
jgi:hypothetical protein